MSQGDQMLRLTVRACILLATLAALALALIGQVTAGIALAAGLAIGSSNGYLARWSLQIRLPFWVMSLVRLTFLGAAGAVVAVLIAPSFPWLVLAGIGLAQMVMTAIAFRYGVRT